MQGEFMTTITMEQVSILKELLIDYQSYHIDWARLNRESPDYDPDYRVKFPSICLKAAAVIEQLERAVKVPAKQTT